MIGSRLNQVRRKVGIGVTVAVVAGVAWTLTPGLPVWRGPHASASARAAGLALFSHQWEPHDTLASGDGLGPVFNGRSCVECHFQGGIGGGGDNSHNVMAFDAHPTEDRPEVKGGIIHKFAVENRLFENRAALRAFFPIVPNGVTVVEGCSVRTHDFDPVHTETVNTSALFGAGWIDRIPGKTISNHHLRRTIKKIGHELGSDFGGVGTGRPRILSGGRVGKFGWKAQFATLDEFVAAACANEIGLGNPRMSQARPMVSAGYPDVAADLNRGQFRSLVAFVDTLPRPVAVVPKDGPWRAMAERGEQLFEKVGCAVCHTPDVGGVAGVYSDFLLHRLDDPANPANGYGGREKVAVPLPEAFPLPEEWKTPPLWGVADSAPYFHDGGSPTLADAIARHLGDAEDVTRGYLALAEPDRLAIISFLMTLKAPSDALPIAPASSTLVAAAR
jgi:mono/diheme cytochrome c family protein